jgi:NAD(P)-dependent dehydrogenase (short-subunit alcohol dehydrogenase family)
MPLVSQKRERRVSEPVGMLRGKVAAHMSARIAMGRSVQARERAEVAVFLASDRSSLITGSRSTAAGR